MTTGEASPPAAATQDADYRQSVLSDISREMVRLYKEQFGRGPTKARTNFAGPDIVVATLEDTFTPAEKSLADMGEHQRLRDTRLYFQYATDKEFTSVIERILGRKVRAFNSAIDTRADVCVEVFHLQPLGEDGDGRSGEAAEGEDGA